MKGFGEKELRLAYLLWLQFKPLAQIDEALEPFLKCVPKIGWLKMARESLQLSSSDLAKRLAISRQTYLELEKSELRGTIKILTLQRAAEAMDCELVYAIKPKTNFPFSRIIWEELLKDLNHRICNRKYPEHMKGHILALRAKGLMQSPKYRLSKGWSRRA